MSEKTKHTDTDTMDMLFLELSQFTKATTAKELKLQERESEARSIIEQAVSHIEFCKDYQRGDMSWLDRARKWLGDEKVKGKHTIYEANQGED